MSGNRKSPRPVLRRAKALFWSVRTGTCPPGTHPWFTSGWARPCRGFQPGKDIDDYEYPQVRDSNKCPEGDLNPLSHGAMSRLFAQQCRSKWVWAASCYPFARV